MDHPTAILVTRPGTTGSALVDALRERGAEALWLPSFELGPAPDPHLVATTLQRLAEFDLAIFVSPAAVRGAAAALPPQWPARTRAAVVGTATASALRAQYTAAPPRIVEPAGEASAGGSEALWAALEAKGGLQEGTPSSVLILRAAHGREWLAEHLRAIGANVTTLAVYTRSACAMAPAARARLAAWIADGRAIATVLTSSEAVGVLAQQLAVDPALRATVLAGRALASHERVAAAARAAGFAQVTLAAPEPDALLAAG